MPMGARRRCRIILGNDLARPLIREILREIDCTPKRFRQELDNL